MNKRNFAVKILSVILAMLMLGSTVSIMALAQDPTQEPSQEQPISHALVLKSESLTVAVRRTVQMTASVTNVETQPEITWTSLNEKVATVDRNGLVKGVGEGEAVIIASAEVDGETLTGEFAINVVTGGNLLKDLLVKQQILSYQYSYHDDYYYTNDKDAWQYNFGFGKIYDLAAPYILLEYDYIRVFFTYEDKDWMLQMWKGQYGMIFYGGEIGIYNRPHSEKGVNDWTMYNCPAEEDWLDMEMTLYHCEKNGTWKREFTREYGKYWWCTGFKNGHLRKEEPANELRMVGRITFKDEEMQKIVSDGLKECGFKEVESKDSIGLDQYYAEGKDVYFTWQNISEAESTMAIKVSVGIISSLVSLPFIWPFLPIIFPFIGGFAVLVILASLIV